MKSTHEHPAASLARQLALNGLCDEFEGLWKVGRRPSIEAFLARLPDTERGELLHELIALDVEYRRKAGQNPALDDYGALVRPSDLASFAPYFQKFVGRISLPATLGEYELSERIGGGGMGEVFRARHRRMNRTVAVKVLAAPDGDVEKMIGRFERETEITALLSHPNVVTAFDAREDAGVRYLVTEYMPRGDLGHLIRAGGPLPVATAVSQSRQAAIGLSHAHRKGVVHRDVKPGNLLLDATGTVRVADWGLARIRSDSGVEDAPDVRLTDLGLILGTVDYMSPEQASRADLATGSADVYSLGCVLFYLLAGRPPFAGGSALDRMAAHRSARPPDIRELRPDVPASLAELVDRMLAKDVGDRPPGMDDVVAALDRLSKTETNEWAKIAVAPPAAKPERRLNRRAWLAGGFALVAVGGVGWRIFRKRPTVVKEPPREPEIAIQSLPLENPKEYQRRWAAKSGVEVEMTDARGVRLVLIPPGTFRMGSPPAEIERWADPLIESLAFRRSWIAAELEKSVTVERPFYLGRTEVTFAEYAAFIADTGHKTRGERYGGGWGYNSRDDQWSIGQKFNWKSLGDFKPRPNHPAGNLSWEDARKFCEWLTASAPKGVRYRLPGESEWELACRACGAGTWCCDEGELEKFAIFGSYRQPQPVAGRQPNAFALFDLHGNLPEWCDAVDPWVREPACPAHLRPARGGAFHSPAAHVRSAAFQWLNPESPDPGFRVLREIAV